MFTIIAVLVLLGPPLAIVLTVGAGAVLTRSRPILGLSLLGLAGLLSLMLIWQFQYDIGLNLPVLDWMPTGAAAETTMFVLAALILAILLFATITWPLATRRVWMTVVPAFLWGLILVAAYMMGQINFSH